MRMVRELGMQLAVVTQDLAAHQPADVLVSAMDRDKVDSSRPHAVTRLLQEVICEELRRCEAMLVNSRVAYQVRRSDAWMHEACEQELEKELQEAKKKSQAAPRTASPFKRFFGL